MNKYVRWGIIGFELVLIVSLVQGIGKSREARGRVAKLSEEKRELLESRGELMGELEYIQSSDYLEKVAREELNLSQPGETVIIVPESALIELPLDEESELGEKAIWEQWWEVIVGEE